MFTATLTNSSYSLGSSLNRNIHIYNNVSRYHDFAWGDFMTLDLHCSYDRSKPAESFDLTRTDMLHRLTNVRYAINAQGRTETRYNCIPRYVMLTAGYKL